jgi:hypothetical protein
MALLFDTRHSDFLPEKLKNILDDNHIVFPAFINAHDHLDFNLFPLLTEKKYTDYIEWGTDLHKTHDGVIKSILKIPLAQRIQFGLLKNLVNGMGGVVHHGLHHKLIRQVSSFPVYLNYRYIHAIATDKKWKLKLNLSASPIMIHLGEGIAANASDEIDQVIKYNFFERKIIAIHAIPLSERQAKKLDAVIWCPASNINLYGSTMNVESIIPNTLVMFGTDSTLSADANFWEHLRLVRGNLVEDIRLYEIIQNSNRYFQKSSPFRNWVVAKRKDEKFLNSFFQINPSDIQLVWLDGESWLCDDVLPFKPSTSIPIQVGTSIKWVKKELGDVVSVFEKNGLELPLGIKSA